MRKFFEIVLLILLLTAKAESQGNQGAVKHTSAKNLGTINTPYDEYSPILSHDGLMMIFTSRRPTLKTDIAKKAQGMENIYVSYYDDMTWKWSKAKMLSEKINEPGINNSALALSNNGQRMLLYRDGPEAGFYESVLNGEEWSQPIKQPKSINDEKHEFSVGISPDGKTIYFASKRTSGQGGLDIWFCKQDSKGNWGKAENLGAPENTTVDEEGVFVHPDEKTIYFSSKKRNSAGGFDILMSAFENGKWSSPVKAASSYSWIYSQDDIEGNDKNRGASASKSPSITNAGETVNTPFDEYAPVLSADGLMMIFTSRRPVLKEDIASKIQGNENVYVSYYDDYTWKWSAAKMLGETINQPGKNNSAIALSNDGQRMLLYRGDPDGNIYESDLKGEEWLEPVELPKPINSKKHESSASISPDGRTIYFVSNRKGGQGGLDIWLCRQDTKGAWGEAENLGDSINTAQDEEGVFIHPDGKTLYFSSKGHNSIGGYDIFKSVFENNKWSTPVIVADSINTPGDDLFFSLTADGKTGYYSSVRGGGLGGKDIYEINFKNLRNKKNESRLTLFKGVVIDNDSFEPIGADIEISDNDKNEVIARIKSNSSTGKFLVSLPAGKNYGINIKKEGHLFYSENFNIPLSAAYKEIDKHIPLQKINIGNKIALKNIFYDYGKATLRPESISELNQLVKLLNVNPEIVIEISSFTDSKSSDEFNLKLSLARSQAVVDFLFASGISRDQVVAKGYGKANPIASNETEEGRQLNRRTEMKVLYE